jgi:NAD(P)-dependent dehydrogenase (short-subunit alcohol dehydrogenase family)
MKQINIKNRLENKSVLLTGGSGHLGQSFAYSIAQNGGFVYITDIDSSKIDHIVSEINTLFPNSCDGSVMDINSEISIDSCLKLINKKKIPINSLINNAYPFNKGYGANIDNISFEDFNENISMHVGGYFSTTNFFLKAFSKQKTLSIINIASIYGVMAPDFDIYDDEEFTMPLEYGISKSSIIYLTKYLSKYYKNSSYRFNAISPGGIYRDHSENFTKNYNSKCLEKGLLEEKDILGSIIFLLSDESQFIKGQNIIVDDGFTL